MNELPKGWTRGKLGDVVSGFQTGRNLSAAGVPAAPDEYGVLKISSVTWGRFDPTKNKALPRGVRPLSHETVRGGDLLVSRANTAELVGAAVLADRDYPQLMLPDKILRVLYDRSLVEPRFLLHALRTQEARRYIEAQASGSSTSMRNLSQPKLLDIPLVLAPLAEQQRIADKLDALLARVDACRDRLARVPAILKRLRRSVLEAAATGALTRAWRSERGLADEAVATLPSGWRLCKVSEAGRVQLGRQRAPKYHSGTSMRPYLRVQNVFEDRLDLSDVMEMDFQPADIERFELHPGDILLNEGQSPQFLGRPAMYRGELPGACFTNSLIRFQAGPDVRPAFALLVFRHHMHSGRYMDEGKITTNIAHLGSTRFGGVEFPVPPLEEQDEIVSRAETLLERAEAAERQFLKSRGQLERTAPSILAKAFRGELLTRK